MVSSVNFLINQELHGIESRLVKEIIWIPELYWHPSLPSVIAGMFSYHGKVIPVLDLHHWVTRSSRKFRIYDQVIVVDWMERSMGLLVDKVQDVTSWEVEQVGELSSQGTVPGSSPGGDVAIGRMDGQSIRIDELSHLLQKLENSEIGVNLNSLAFGLLEAKGRGKSDLLIPVRSPGFEQISQEEDHILRERAETLARSEPEMDAQQWITLAVVRLNEEYLGLDPLVVREFAALDHLVPVPCCPDFVVGHMNLRGEVLTVFDLRYVLSIPIVENPPLSQVAVIQVDTCLMGIAVQDALDCVSCQFDGGSLSQLQAEDSPFRKEIGQYQGKALQYLDVRHLVTSQALEVYEEV